MKRIILTFTLPILFLAGLLNSCGLSAISNEAEIFAEEFYGYLSEKDYDSAMGMIDEEGLKISTSEEWLNVLTQKDQLGKFIGYKKDIGFNTNINNSVTTVNLNYTCNYEKITLYEKITMVKRGDKFKIITYQYNEDKNKLSD